MIKKIVFFLAIFLFSERYFAQLDLQKDSSSVNDTQLSDTAHVNSKLPIFSTSGDDAESDLDNQDASSLLQSSRDVFTQFASFQFGAGRFRMRGLAAENQQVLINGVNLGNLENGYTSWSSWGGLNDVTRYVENRVGNVSSRYAFSGPGGYTNIDSKASSFKKGSRFTYSFGNRIYRHRAMLTHSTGMMQNGWAFTLSASIRQGNEVYIPGTFFNANSFYLSADKRLNDKHLLSFTGFYAPMQTGRSSYATQETYQLAKSNYYNDNWGYQDGKVRNASVSHNNRPVLMLSHLFNIHKNSRLTSSIMYTFGKAGVTALQWNSPKTPKPDYYYYLPSYYYDRGQTDLGNQLAGAWASDVNTHQINWDRMISINRNNYYTLPSQLGQGINTTETRALYIVEDHVENLKNFGFNTVYNARIDRLFVSAGLNGNIYRNRKYKVLDDLLGASYWLDYDRFALVGQPLAVSNMYQQNNLAAPDKKIKVGDVFGYDYSMNVNRGEAWGQAEYSFNKLDVYAGLTLSRSQIWREGYMANGKFPDNSKGSSQLLNFLNYGVKAGAIYKFGGRHFLTVNGTILTRPPEVSNSFISPRVRNDVVSGLSSEKVLSCDINYMIKYPTLKVRATYFNTQINNQFWVRTYWSDLFNNNVDLIMRGVNQNNQGMELGIEKTLLTAHVLQAAFSYGQYIYTDRPTIDAWRDNNAAPLYQGRTTYLKNFRIGSTPQMVLGIGYRYNAKKHWYAGVNVNYFDQIYVEPNPDRRTKESVDNVLQNLNYLSDASQQYNTLINQERVPGYYTINVNGGKSFRVARKYFLNASISINNMTNNKKIIINGFEQLRWEPSNLSKFDNKYVYMTGATYMINLNFSF